jgi:hypothetical protein
MDIISHALIGWIICLIADASGKEIFWIILFSIIPDIVLIPAYIKLGRENKRFLWIAKNKDWSGETLKYPFLAALYNTTHSLFFLVIIVYPAIKIFNLPNLIFAAYLLHIATDILSHKGEWAIKLFYPFKLKINGLSDVWAWPFYLMAIAWITLITIIEILI